MNDTKQRLCIGCNKVMRNSQNKITLDSVELWKHNTCLAPSMISLVETSYKYKVNGSPETPITRDYDEVKLSIKEKENIVELTKEEEFWNTKCDINIVLKNYKYIKQAKIDSYTVLLKSMAKSRKLRYCFNCFCWVYMNLVALYILYSIFFVDTVTLLLLLLLNLISLLAVFVITMDTNRIEKETCKIEQSFRLDKKNLEEDIKILNDKIKKNN